MHFEVNTNTNTNSFRINFSIPIPIPIPGKLGFSIPIPIPIPAKTSIPQYQYQVLSVSGINVLFKDVCIMWQIYIKGARGVVFAIAW